MLERGGGGFGSGSHATTRMCLALLLELEPAGGAADLGCGLGTLAIAAARLGWAPVVGVDRMAGAVDAARANAGAQRRRGRLGGGRPRGGPGPARAARARQRPAAGARASRRGTAVGRTGPASPGWWCSGVVPGELAPVTAAYAAAGWRVGRALEEEGWAAALLERGDG